MSATDPTGSSDNSNHHDRRPSMAAVLLIVLLALVVGTVAGQDYLPNRYHEVPDLATYAVAVFVIWRQTSICCRLASTVDQQQKLFSVRFWVGIIVNSLLLRFGDIYRPTGRYAVRFATDFGLLMAFLESLRLVEHLLKSATPNSDASVVRTQCGETTHFG